MDPGSAAFWVALVEVVWVNILLSGDNAVVIALAARSLPSAQRAVAIVIGAAAAIILRIGLTVIAVELLRLPGLKLVGGVLLFYIGITLLRSNADAGDGVESHSNIWSAVRVILVADLIMSLDNILAVAAAAHNSLFLLAAGLIISIPLVIFGSTLLVRVIDRFPVIVWLGAGMIGFIAGRMLFGDPVLCGFVAEAAVDVHTPVMYLSFAAGIIGAGIVLALGKLAR